MKILTKQYSTEQRSDEQNWVTQNNDVGNKKQGSCTIWDALSGLLTHYPVSVPPLGKSESQVHTDILGLLTKDQMPCVIHTDGPWLNTADIILLLGIIFCALLQQLSVISSIITFEGPLISLMSFDTKSILWLLIQYVLCPFFVTGRQELTRLTLVSCPNPDAGGATLWSTASGKEINLKYYTRLC